MLRVWKREPLTFPSGITRDEDSLKATGDYDTLLNSTCAIEIDEDGVTSAYYTIKQLKDAYGITEPDPEKALALVIEAQKAAEEAAKKEAVTLDDLQAQLEEQAAAIEELASIAAGGEQ